MPEKDLSRLPSLLGIFQEHPPPVHIVRPEHIPEPYRTLLVHDWDMTPTLAEFHQCEVGIRVLDFERGVDTCSRRVVLLDQHKMPIEYGAITIYLNTLPPGAVKAILEARTPVGTVLEQNDVDHSSHPVAFFKVAPDLEMRDALLTEDHSPLFGRYNRLTAPDGSLIAEVLEVLPLVKGS